MDDVYDGSFADDDGEEGSQESYSEDEGYEGGQDDINPVDGDPGMDAIYNGTAMDGSQESVDGDGGYGMPSGGAGESSPDVYSSIARALTEDGILNLPDIDGVHDAATFRQAIEAEIYNRLTPMQRRVNAALGVGVRPNAIQQYETAMNEAASFTDERIADESDEGQEARKNLIYQGCLARGMTQQQAEREVNKSFKAGTDIEDAKDARDVVMQSLQGSYQRMLNNQKAQRDNEIAASQRFQQSVYDSVANDDGRMFGSLTANTKRLVLNNLMNRSIRLNDGSSMTPVEAYAAQDPVGFQKAVGVIFTLTDGFKNFDRLGDIKANRSVKRGIAGLEKALRSTGAGGGGAYKYANNVNGREEDDEEIILR